MAQRIKRQLYKCMFWGTRDWSYLSLSLFSYLNCDHNLFVFRSVLLQGLTFGAWHLALELTCKGHKLESDPLCLLCWQPLTYHDLKLSENMHTIFTNFNTKNTRNELKIKILNALLFLSTGTFDQGCWL